MSLIRSLASRTRPARIHARGSASAALPNFDIKPTRFGQPLFPSHSHLIKPNEVTPGLPIEEYERRRKALMDSLPDDSMVVSVAGPVKYMSGHIFYKFRQASDFWYLTGFEEPDSAVILEKDSSPKGYRMTLFSLGRDFNKEKWEGARTSPDDAIRYFKADDAQSIAIFPTLLKAIASVYSNIYIDIPVSASISRRRSLSKALLRTFAATARSWNQSEYDNVIDSLSSKKLRSLGEEVSRLRAVKSEPEQAIMRQAADISGTAHAKTMRFARPGMSEHMLSSHFEYLCALEGSQRPAYVPVVASGPNALIIHYTSNNQIIRDDELILIDAGCEYNGYVSDITRAFPANDVFTPPQAALYDAILQAQKYLITLCTESAGLTLNQVHRESVDALRKELNRIGFNLQGASGTSDLEHVLYPHYVGHHVGLDLHETSPYSRNEPLKAGNVITIEPGIYVPPSPLFPKEYHNIGIRIEDEVLVGKDHPIVLTVAAPKEIADVEGACQGLLGMEPY